MAQRPSSVKLNSPHEDALVFIAERLNELSSVETLDSFRAPTVNIPSLLREAVDQLTAINNAESGVPERSIEPIISEICERYSGNPICSAIIRSDRMVVDRLRSASIQELGFMLPQLKQELSEWAYATETMRLLIEAVPTNKKSLIDQLCRNLVTSLVNLGMSRRHVHEAVIKFFWNDAADYHSPECLRTFFLKVFPHGHNFLLCFAISGAADQLHNQKFDALDIVISEEPPAQFVALAKSLIPVNGGKHSFVIVKEITALDRHSAIEIGRRRISLLKNLFRMYNHEKTLSLYDGVLVEQCCEEGITIVEAERHGRKAVRDASTRLASKRLSSILKTSAFLRGVHYEKFVSVSEFHGLSEDSESSSNKLLNLWISLETICPSIKGNSKIDSVIAGVLPTISLLYINRKISALAQDLARYDKNGIAPILGRASDISSSKRLQLLAICAQSVRSQTLNDLFAALGGSPLLRNRLFVMSEELASIKAINKMLDKHHDNVAWQLRRIYRARNMIVHSGRIPKFIEALVDSAHEYFDQLLGVSGNISRGPNGFSNFDTAFNFLEWEYKTYRAQMSDLDLNDNESMNALLWRRRKAVSRFDVLQQGPRN